MNWDFEARHRMGEFTLDVHCTGGTKPVALIGPNGAGKSTILRIFCGMLRPESGRIRVSRATYFDGPAGIWLSPAERNIGYVPQGGGLFPHLNVLDNVAFGPKMRGRPKAAAQEIAYQTLAELGCETLVGRTPQQLSGGEIQKVALARAMANKPDLLLLDEPLNALDIPTKRAYRLFLKSYLSEKACASIFVTHDVRDVLTLDAEVIVIESGIVQQMGSVHSLSASPSSPFVEEFFGPMGVSMGSDHEG